eukprot:gnl/TRDRNA2_/TRDRNA2_87836_c1_seq1.p1 gnl/TRDRNA2_/TRDRNA2_87836_c1~~gnl/TRDRNA2_/TRDRNA2_87836_c1_seq1.p1  ORF type:complete len:354 (+),score=56.55 gnl/TRDRNA2_/TRDRNA2_87836_c1_seq1:2-1063(+)
MPRFTAVPIIEEAPWAGIVLLAVLVTVNLGILNLLLTAIVDRAQETREQDEENKLRLKQKSYEAMRKKLMQICQDLDVDGDGQITLGEIIDGVSISDKFEKLLRLMDVHEDDLRMVFHILDEDGSGSVSFEEFSTQIHRMKTQETHTMLLIMKGHIKDLERSMYHFISDFKAEILDKIAGEAPNSLLVERKQNGQAATSVSTQEVTTAPQLPSKGQPADSVATSLPASLELSRVDLDSVLRSIDEHSNWIVNRIVERTEGHATMLQKNSELLAELVATLPGGPAISGDSSAQYRREPAYGDKFGDSIASTVPSEQPRTCLPETCCGPKQLAQVGGAENGRSAQITWHTGYALQ